MKILLGIVMGMTLMGMIAAWQISQIQDEAVKCGAARWVHVNCVIKKFEWKEVPSE